MNNSRCPWALADALSKQYHDEEWGVPCSDDQRLFEFLILEGAQAGLSWSLILKKRKNYKKSFCEFDPEKVARFDKRNVESLLKNEGIIRNRLKIESAIKNAKAFLKIQEEFGSFSNYLWAFVDNKPIVNQWKTPLQVPAKTKLSGKLSKDLQKRGFNFVGSTICYAYMQAIGMVDDHLVSCYKKATLKRP